MRMNRRKLSNMIEDLPEPVAGPDPEEAPATEGATEAPGIPEEEETQKEPGEVEVPESVEEESVEEPDLPDLPEESDSWIPVKMNDPDVEGRAAMLQDGRVAVQSELFPPKVIPFSDFWGNFSHQDGRKVGLEDFAEKITEADLGGAEDLSPPTLGSDPHQQQAPAVAGPAGPGSGLNNLLGALLRRSHGQKLTEGQQKALVPESFSDRLAGWRNQRAAESVRAMDDHLNRTEHLLQGVSNNPSILPIKGLLDENKVDEARKAYRDLVGQESPAEDVVQLRQDVTALADSLDKISASVPAHLKFCQAADGIDEAQEGEKLSDSLEKLQNNKLLEALEDENGRTLREKIAKVVEAIREFLQKVLDKLGMTNAPR